MQVSIDLMIMADPKLVFRLTTYAAMLQAAFFGVGLALVAISQAELAYWGSMRGIAAARGLFGGE